MKKLRSMRPPFEDEFLTDDQERWFLYEMRPAPPDKAVALILLGGLIALSAAVLLVLLFV